MAIRPDQDTQNAIIQVWTVTGSGTVTANMPVTLTAEKTARNSTAGENPSGIALSSATSGGTFDVALLSGAVIIPVRVGTAGATAGAYAVVGTTGLTDQTLGGGTTVKYVAGKFNQTGVSADVVGLVVGQFAGVGS